MSDSRNKATTCADLNHTVLPTSAIVLVTLHKRNMFIYWTCQTWKYIFQFNHVKEIYISMQITQRDPSRSQILSWTWHGVFSYMEFKPEMFAFSHNIFSLELKNKQKAQIRISLRRSALLKVTLITKFYWELNWGFARVVTDMSQWVLHFYIVKRYIDVHKMWG